MVALGKKRAAASPVVNGGPAKKHSKRPRKKIASIHEEIPSDYRTTAEELAPSPKYKKLKKLKAAQAKARTLSQSSDEVEAEVTHKGKEAKTKLKEENPRTADRERLQAELEEKRRASDEVIRSFRQGNPEEVLRALDQVSEFLYNATSHFPPHLRIGRSNKFQGLSGTLKFKKAKKRKGALDEDAIVPLVLRLAEPTVKQEEDDDESAEHKSKTLGDLEKKLNEMKGKRVNYKEKLLKKKLKNKIKKKKSAEKRKQMKAERKQEPPKVETEAKPKVPKMEKPVKDEIVFSKLDFSSDLSDQKPRVDPKRALQKLEKTKQFMKKLIDSGKEDKADEIMSKTKWKSAIMKAEGVKVRDNEELLKKAIKKKSQVKARSKKKWEDRNDQLKKKMDDAQKKRNENLDKRKKQKKNVKIKRAVKKGRMLPS